MEDMLFWLGPLLLLVIVLGALSIKWLVTDWDVVRDTGVWRYEANRATGERRAVRIGHGHQPVDMRWVDTGRWAAILFLCVLASPAFATSEYATSRKITYKRAYAPLSIKVIDGDTLHASLKGGVRKVRLVGIDAPELHVACEAERGRAARDALAAFVTSGRVLIKEATQLDKYGRRLGAVRVGKADAAQHLLATGKVHAYDGGKRPSWPGCE